MVIKKQIWMQIIEPGKKALVEFVSSPKNDVIADQFCFLLSHILYDPLLHDSILQTEKETPLSFTTYLELVKEEYPQSEMKEGVVIVRRKENIIATVNLFSRCVDCRD